MKGNLAARAGRWSATHRRAAILGWLAFVVAAFVLGGAVGFESLDDEDTMPGKESGQASTVISGAFPDETGEAVLIQGGDARTRAAAASDAARRFEALAVVDSVDPPMISEDGGSTLVPIKLAQDGDQAEDDLETMLATTRAVGDAHPGLRVEQFGDVSATVAFDEAMGEDFKRAEKLSIPLTLIILVVAFGSLMAAGLPVLLALSAVAATIGVVSGVSQLFPMDDAVNSIVLLIGLAVGVDYSLFYLRREREERAAGRSAEAALEAAAATSGRAVLVSGVTVMIAMSGMYLAGAPTFTGLATGAILVVGIALIASITVLPAVLSTLGDRVEKGRVPFIPRREESRVWNAILTPVLRRPKTVAALSAAVLVALAIPALGMRVSVPGMESMSRDMPIMQTYDRVQKAFPEEAGPAQVVVQAADVSAPEVKAAIAALDPADVEVAPGGKVVVASVVLPGDGTDERSKQALAVLRERTVPRAFGSVSGVEVGVTGTTAWAVDFNDLMTSRAPIVFAFVLTLAFLLLLVTFRSVVIPIKAILLNLLSVAAAYGVLTLVFQDDASDSITAWLPMFLFVVLFGLSMDYHVFILSRVRELVDRGMPTEDAVAQAIRSTAGTVTSAAVVMVAVFAVFATLRMVEFRQMGVGLSVAILLDATIVRAVLLPATMKLLGEWNWWLPRRLEWLPRVRHEGAAA